jgi:hypothetical protein
MKLKKIIMAAGAVGAISFFMAGMANAQTPVLVQTQTNTWVTSRDVVITGAVSSGFNTNGVTGSTSVSQYTGVLDLSRVVIKISQAAPAQSATINASISIASGSTTFTGVAGENRITESTAFLGGDVSVYSAVVAAGGDILDYSKTKPGTNYAGQTLTSPGTVGSTVSITQAATTLFDSNLYGSLTTANLNAIFRDGTSIGFGYSIGSSFYFSRDNTTLLTANLTGTNSGQITIEYYAVPEPSTYALLIVAGGLGLVAVRRQRAAARKA